MYDPRCQDTVPIKPPEIQYMKSKLSVIRVLIVSITLSFVLLGGAFLLVPYYINHKITQELSKRGVIAEYKLEVNGLNFILRNFKTTYRGVEVELNKVEVHHSGREFVDIRIEGGSIQGSLKEQLEQVSQGNSENSYHIHASDISLLDIEYKGHIVRGKLNSAGFLSGHKFADMEFIELPQEFPNSSIKNIQITGKHINVGYIKSSEDLHKIVEQYKNKRIEKNSSNSNSSYEVIIKEAEYFHGGYKINAYGLDPIQKHANLVKIFHNGHSVSFTDLSINISKEVWVKVSEISTSINSISNKDISIEDVDLKIEKKEDFVIIQLRIHEFISEGSIRLRGNTPISIKWKIPENGCQSIISSLPESLKTTIKEFTFDGTFALDVEVNLENPLSKIRMTNKCKSLKYPESFSKKAMKTEFTRIAFNTKNEPIDIVTGPLSNNWISYGAVSKYVPIAIIACEDMGFYNHKGIHIEAIENSITMNLKSGKFSRGGSTISMQTAKNLWLNREKTISRKIQEAFLTTHLESILTKEEIIETYMNIVEFSPGEYGIRKAASKFFSTSASNLSLGQSILIALQLPNPRSVSWNADGNISSNKLNLIKQIIKNIEKRGMITPDEAEEALKEEIVIGKANATKDLSEVVIPDGLEW